MKSFSLSIFITSCHRNNPTIGKTLNSLEKSVEGLSGITVDVLVDLHRKNGCFKSYHKALTLAIKAKKEWVLVVPDDMLFTPRWIYRVQEAIESESLGYIALYTPKGLGERYGMQRGFNELKGGWASSWGGCYLMKTDVAKRVVANKFYKDHLSGKLDGEHLHNYAPNKRIDHCIPEVIHQLKLKQLYIAPSVCTHKGYESTLGHTHTENEDAFIPGK